jgi:hypothetical protein
MCIKSEWTVKREDIQYATKAMRQFSVLILISYMDTWTCLSQVQTVFDSKIFPRTRNTGTIWRQDARIHVSEPDFEVLTQGGLLIDSSLTGGITVVEFEKIMRAQLVLHVQAGLFIPC